MVEHTADRAHHPEQQIAEAVAVAGGVAGLADV